MIYEIIFTDTYGATTLARPFISSNGVVSRELETELERKRNDWEERRDRTEFESPFIVLSHI